VSCSFNVASYETKLILDFAIYLKRHGVESSKVSLTFSDVRRCASVPYFGDGLTIGPTRTMTTIRCSISIFLTSVLQCGTSSRTSRTGHGAFLDAFRDRHQRVRDSKKDAVQCTTDQGHEVT
jgi:hypothetical protein